MRLGRWVLGLAVVIPLAGCASGPSVEERIEDRVSELSDAVDGARVDLQKDVFTQDVIVTMWVPEATDENLASAVEAAYEASWETADFQPSYVNVFVSEAPLEDDPERQGAEQYLDLEALNDLDVHECQSNWCSAPAASLEDRFGPWGEQ